MERKTVNVPAEFKVNRKERLIEGYASVFDVVDLGGDIVRKGAFAEAIDRAGTIPVLWQHNHEEPIGVHQSLEEDDHGLKFVWKIAKTRRGDEALELADMGAATGVSIGYDILQEAKAKSASDGFKRELIELFLHENSQVTFPMLPDARITAVKEARAKATIQDQAITGGGVGQFFGSLLAEAGETRTEIVENMAEALGVTLEDVQAIIAGEPACPSLETIATMSAAMGVPEEGALEAGRRAGCEYPEPEAKALTMAMDPSKFPAMLRQMADMLEANDTDTDDEPEEVEATEESGADEPEEDDESTKASPFAKAREMFRQTTHGE